jgi:hypothetical protein
MIIRKREVAGSSAGAWFAGPAKRTSGDVGDWGTA